jgi:colanic acid biosynthesis glycosyl transferase WcaI
MHLLVIGINYTPEQTSVGPFTTGLCEHLAEQGHRVSVMTAFPYYPQWRIHDEYRGMVYKRERINDVDVRRVIHFVPSKPRNLIQRLLHDASFAFNSLLAIPSVGTFDGIFCSCPPPFVPTIAWLASRLRGVPFAMQLTDLATDGALAVGMMKGRGGLAGWARVLENFNYRQAAGISVLCPAFKERLIEQGVPPGKIYLVPTWADVETIRPLPRDNGFRHRNSLDNADFVALHAGNMGLKQGLQTVVEAARVTEASSSGITWMLVGDGEERRRLQESAVRYGLTRLRFLPLQPNDMVPFMLAAADVCLVVQKATVTDMVIPSKLLTYMASGRPIVASVHPGSATAHRIREADCGLIVPPEDPQSLVEAVERLRAVPTDAQRLGSNGRAYVEKHFAKQVVLDLYDQFLAAVFPEFGSVEE